MAASSKPRIPHAEGRRIFGAALFVLGVLAFFGGRAWEGIAALLMNSGAFLYIWGSLLYYLRGIEERQIDLARQLQEKSPPGG